MAKKTYTLELTEAELMMLQTTWTVCVTGDNWFDGQNQYTVHQPHEIRTGKRLTQKIEDL
jgi:hypothetical protein